MTHKEEYLEYWHLTPGTPEAEKAWQDKVDMMNGKRRFAPMVFVSPDICYDSPVDGRPITSKAARIEDLKRTGCIEYDPGMKQDHERSVKEADERLDRSVDALVERQIHEMPARKREKLAAELQQGLTVEPVRTSPGA